MPEMTPASLVAWRWESLKYWKKSFLIVKIESKLINLLLQKLSSPNERVHFYLLLQSNAYLHLL